MSGGWFIAGTDTGAGKTRVACRLLEALRDAGHTAVGMKPVASGCVATADGWRNDDALALMAASGVAADYADVNPWALEAACAPHIAARQQGVEIGLEKILASFARLRRKAPWVVVEGVGGWMVPLGDDLTTADLARALQLPVILVVGLRLGCINHALLTLEAIRRADVALAGWVANPIDPAMTHVAENIAALERRLPAPLLARLAYETPGTGKKDLSGFSAETIMHLTQKAD